MKSKVVSVTFEGNTWILMCCAWHQWALDHGMFDDPELVGDEATAPFVQLLVLLKAAQKGASPALDETLTKIADDVSRTLREYSDRFLLTAEIAARVEALVRVRRERA